MNYEESLREFKKGIEEDIKSMLIERNSGYDVEGIDRFSFKGVFDINVINHDKVPFLGFFWKNGAMRIRVECFAQTLNIKAEEVTADSLIEIHKFVKNHSRTLVIDKINKGFWDTRTDRLKTYYFDSIPDKEDERVELIRKYFDFAWRVGEDEDTFIYTIKEGRFGEYLKAHFE